MVDGRAMRVEVGCYCMKELKDTQNEVDPRGVPIQRVGVRALRFPVRIRDKKDALQHTVATVSLGVDLPHNYKGTHMSRFIETLNAHGPELSVRDIRRIPQELLGRLDAERAHVEVSFPYFIEKRAPVTGAPGMLDYEVKFTVDATKDEMDLIVTVAVPVATLCPCSKAISDRGAHNQRGIVTYSVRFDEPIWIEDLIRVVELSASCELYATLKRPDEKAVTEIAYDNPVFVEDLVRNIAVKSRGDENISWFRVEAENFESIHNHNAFAEVEWVRGGEW